MSANIARQRVVLGSWCRRNGVRAHYVRHDVGLVFDLVQEGDARDTGIPNWLQGDNHLVFHDRSSDVATSYHGTEFRTLMHLNDARGLSQISERLIHRADGHKRRWSRILADDLSLFGSGTRNRGVR